MHEIKQVSWSVYGGVWTVQENHIYIGYDVKTCAFLMSLFSVLPPNSVYCGTVCPETWAKTRKNLMKVSAASVRFYIHSWKELWNELPRSQNYVVNRLVLHFRCDISHLQVWKRERWMSSLQKYTEKRKIRRSVPKKVIHEEKQLEDMSKELTVAVTDIAIVNTIQCHHLGTKNFSEDGDSICSE